MEPPQDPTQEAKSLASVSILQQFAWLGLRRSDTNKSAEASAFSMEGDGDGVIWFDDLILWNLMGFAADTGPDFLNCHLVCKRWKSMVEKVVPPIIVEMT